MDILDRTDFCVNPWTELSIGSNYCFTCCWDGQRFHQSFPLPFASGPWSGEINLDNQSLISQRRQMLDYGVNACPTTCPYRFCLPTVREQLQRFRIDERTSEALDGIVDDLQYGIVRPVKPFLVTLIPTMECNQRCAFCFLDRENYNSGSCQTKPTQNQLDNLLPLFDNCAEFTTCGGDLFNMTDHEIDTIHAPFSGRNVKTSTITNARGMTLERYEKYFVHSDTLKSVVISLPTLDRNTYKAYFTGGVLDPIIENIRQITAKYPEHKIESICFVVLSNNIQEMPDMVLFAEKTGIKSVRFNPLDPVFLEKRGVANLDPMQGGFSLDLYRLFTEVKIRMASIRRNVSVNIVGFEHVVKMFDTRLEKE